MERSRYNFQNENDRAKLKRVISHNSPPIIERRPVISYKSSFSSLPHIKTKKIFTDKFVTRESPINILRQFQNKHQSPNNSNSLTRLDLARSLIRSYSLSSFAKEK